MTTQAVLKLTEDQLRTIRTAMETLLAVSAHADSRGNGGAHQTSSFMFARHTLAEALTATSHRSRAPHQHTRDLLELLELAESVELRATDEPAESVPYTSDEQIGCECAFVDAAAAAHCRL